MNRIIALAADHGGYPLKVELAPWLQSQGYEISDLGAHSLNLDDETSRKGKIKRRGNV